LCDSVNEDDGKTVEELKAEMEEKEMKAQAQILEMVGDLHYADEKPPDNVLFVCKLNPVTTDEVVL
jgi:peptidyl-prolyl cis-trans isomerase-like 4